MSLLPTVNRAALKACNLTGTLRKPLTYMHRIPGNYSPETGLTADTETPYTLLVPVVGLLEKEEEWFEAPDKMKRVIIPVLLLPVEPVRTGYIIMTADSSRWEIKKLSIPPAGIYLLYVEGA